MSAAASGAIRLRRPEFTATPEDPFKNDWLKREDHVKGFCGLLTGAHTPFVVSLDGGWGSGKTAFVKMCVAWLKSGGREGPAAQPVMFNAWTQGYTRNALLDLVKAVTAEVASGSGELWHLAGQAARVLLRLVPGGQAGAVLEELLKERENPQRMIEAFKKGLESVAARDEGRLVVFIDELDRCRPDYALDMLEAVRHLFDVPGVVVVLATNRESLDQSVKVLYGDEQDGERYMRRFIDQATRLPELTAGQIAEYRRQLYDETDILSRFYDHGEPNELELIVRLASGPDEQNPRDIDQAVYRVAVVLASLDGIHPDPGGAKKAWERAALTWMTLRSRDRGTYDQVVGGRAGVSAAGPALAAAAAELTEEYLPPHQILYLMGMALLTTHRDGRPLGGRHGQTEAQQLLEKLPNTDTGPALERYRHAVSTWPGQGGWPDLGRLAAVIEMSNPRATGEPPAGAGPGDG